MICRAAVYPEAVRSIESGSVQRASSSALESAVDLIGSGQHPGVRPGKNRHGFATVTVMNHPVVIDPSEHAVWQADRMGKSTLFDSPRLLVGLNAFEPGQSHALHNHPGMDKVYIVVSGAGEFLLEGRELPMSEGDLLVAPDGVPHGVRNTGTERLLVLAVLAPGPSGSATS